MAADAAERKKGLVNSRNEPCLSAQVLNWPTPSARDWKDTPGMAQSATNADGSHRDRTDQLPRKVYANQPQGTTQGGSLNPTWVEWLMGYPSEWTVLED